MTALYIILGILAFFTLVMFIRVTFEVQANDGVSLYLKILFLKFKLFPKKEKPVRLKDFKIKRFRRIRRKEEKSYIKKELKKQQKEDEKAKEKAVKKSETKEKKKEEKSFKEKIDYYTEFIKYVVADALKKFKKYLVITVYYIDISVSGDEPDRTAINYGIACQGVSYINEFLNQNLNMKYKRKRKEHISVKADFLSRCETVSIRISLGIRVWQVLSVLITALIGYIKMTVTKTGTKK